VQYNLFTVSVEKGSNIVQGATGTKFLSKVSAGNSFKVKGDPVVYQIASVDSDTQLSLSTAFAGTTAFNVPYQITTDFTPNFGLAEINIGDQDWPTHLTVETLRKIDEILGYAVGDGVVFKDGWDAATDTPTLPAPDLTNVGWVYKVLVPYGQYAYGDTIISNGSQWVHIPTAEAVAATSAAAALVSEQAAASSAAAAAASAVDSASSAADAQAFLEAMAPASTVTAQAFGDVGTVGVELLYARQDHKHAMPPLPIDITTKTGILKGDGATISPAVAGTDFLAPNGSAAQLTDFPTLNQNTTGNAATATKLATSHTINGVSFDGSANITVNAVDATARIAVSEKGAANGVATLGADAKIRLAAQLPSFVDDVLEFVDLAYFPVVGESGKVYLDVDSNITYRWSGSSYVPIGSDLALGETSSSAYRGDRGKIAYDHSQTVHAPADAEKNVQADWNEEVEASNAFIKNKPARGDDCWNCSRRK